LDDEPTLVRAVKSVKRSMARNQHLQNRYLSLTTSLIPNLVMIFSRATRGGISISFIIFGVGRIIISRWRIGMISLGICAFIFGCILGLPISGLMIPYHPFLLRVYNPAFQYSIHLVGVIILLVILARDVVFIVTLKYYEWKKLKREEEQRQQKLRGIFYTPVKSKRDRGNTREFGNKRDALDAKS
jgi:hypothetical protein